MKTIPRIWLSRTFELCYPDTPREGNFSDIVPSLIPEYEKVRSPPLTAYFNFQCAQLYSVVQLAPTLKSWLQEMHLGLRPSVEHWFFLTNIIRISLLATGIDYSETGAYLFTGQWFSDEPSAKVHGFLQADGRPVAGAALTWFARNTKARHNLGVYSIKWVLPEPERRRRPRSNSWSTR